MKISFESPKEYARTVRVYTQNLLKFNYLDPIPLPLAGQGENLRGILYSKNSSKSTVSADVSHPHLPLRQSRRNAASSLMGDNPKCRYLSKFKSRHFTLCAILLVGLINEKNTQKKGRTDHSVHEVREPVKEVNNMEWIRVYISTNKRRWSCNCPRRHHYSP